MHIAIYIFADLLAEELSGLYVISNIFFLAAQIVAFPVTLVLGYLTHTALRILGQRNWYVYAIAGGLGSLVPLPFWILFLHNLHIGDGPFPWAAFLEISSKWFGPFIATGATVATIFWALGVRANNANQPSDIDEGNFS
jgi:hypothetical protein